MGHAERKTVCEQTALFEKTLRKYKARKFFSSSHAGIEYFSQCKATLKENKCYIVTSETCHTTVGKQATNFV